VDEGDDDPGSKGFGTPVALDTTKGVRNERQRHFQLYPDRVVINLAPDGLESSLPGEDMLLESLGLEYHHIPVAWGEPRLDQLEKFEELMGAVAEKRTLVHCQANYRVTAFFAMYATSKLGWDDERADALINRIWAVRADYEMDENWKSFIAAARRRRLRDAGSV
jgi:protein tyrosine phosphatase (PTP) superfamily phosphohydrolase (DUF442 family)